VNIWGCCDIIRETIYFIFEHFLSISVNSNTDNSGRKWKVQKHQLTPETKKIKMPKPKQKKISDYPKRFSNRYGKVAIYKNANNADWFIFVVAWSVGKHRYRKTFSDEVAAVNHAELLLEQFEKGQALAGAMTHNDALCFNACAEKLNGVPIMDAVEFYVRMNGGGSKEETKIVVDVVPDFLSHQEKQGNSDRDLKTLKSHLKGFSDALCVPLTKITTQNINEYIQAKRELKPGVFAEWANKSKNNVRITLHRFFEWAKDNNRLPKNWENPVTASTTYKVVHSSPGIFTPDDLKKMLPHVSNKWLPYFAISAFAGVRNAEIQRLTWDEVDMEGRHIFLDPRHTKTKRRRVAIMEDCLAEWLKKYTGERKGFLCPEKISRTGTHHREDAPKVADPNKETSAVAKKAGVKWVHNGLRHSYISYQMAIWRDDQKVAEQCGNSPQEVQESYKANTTEKEAKRWFSILPKRF